jgi:ATP-binding cassette, subfamily B, bacterial CvaB/MchF/RaxB
VAQAHGRAVDLPALRGHYPTSLSGVTLKQLMEIADQLGFITRALRFELDELGKLRLPAVLHWGMDHFVVLVEVGGNHVVIHDPGQGRRKLSIAEAARKISGVALEFEPARDFAGLGIGKSRRLKLGDFWSGSQGLGKALIQLGILSVILQIFVLVSPFFVQLTIDEVLTHNDSSLLVVLILGFGLLHVINLITTVLRQYVQLYVGSTMMYQMVSNVMNHLMRLPVRWFQTRHVGDVVSRIGSTQPIQELFREGLITSVIDGVMAIVTLVVMFVYSWKLSLIALLAFALQAAVRIALMHSYRQRVESQIAADAKEMTIRLENIRAIQAIKLYGRESARKNAWANAQADAINQSIRVGKYGISFGAVNTLLDSASTLLIVFFGAQMILSGGFTVGMLMAFSSYRGSFDSASDSLIQEMFKLVMTKLHLDRLSDIVCSEPEVDRTRQSGLDAEINGRLRLENITFRYGPEHPLLCNGVNLDVRPGEAIAITGESGAGKTTLLRLMLGLQSPVSGRILIDERPLSNLSLDSYRRQTAVVMQDDQLLSGTVMDNITFFDPKPDIERAYDCAQMAVLHDDIVAMPMKYHSLIGDMGTILSGGQKQRLLLARALYHRPRILFLDEATSHLDPATERKVIRNLREMNITRIQIAHRMETIRNADRVFEFQNGLLVEVAPEAGETSGKQSDDNELGDALVPQQ